LLDGEDELAVDVLGFRTLGSCLRDLRLLPLVGSHLLSADTSETLTLIDLLFFSSAAETKPSVETERESDLPPSLPLYLYLYIHLLLGCLMEFPVTTVGNDNSGASHLDRPISGSG
ncbi:hypothetical protein GW17_00039423, partial [Ensete ventricosum]